MINFLALNICPIYCACSISVSNAKNSRNILLISVKFPSNTWRYVRMNFSLNIFPHHVALCPDTYFTRIIRFIFLGIGYSVFFCWFLRDPSIIKVVFISHMVLFKTHYLLMLCFIMECKCQICCGLKPNYIQIWFMMYIY